MELSTSELVALEYLQRDQRRVAGEFNAMARRFLEGVSERTGIPIGNLVVDVANKTISDTRMNGEDEDGGLQPG